MNNDLISREALKKAIKNLYNETLDGIVKFGIEKAYKEIDNAPTVEIPCNQIIWEQGYECGKNERPQGEWEEPFEMNGKTYHKCNHCHISSELILIDKFCPNCGADMRGGAENDD